MSKHDLDEVWKASELVHDYLCDSLQEYVNGDYLPEFVLIGCDKESNKIAEMAENAGKTMVYIDELRCKT